MDLQIKNIELRDFRNYENFSSGEFASLNIFTGANGSGKTNVIEAIQLVTSLESFRKPKWDEVVRWGTENAEIKTHLFNEQRNLDVRLFIANKKRTYFLNDKARSMPDLRGLLPSVLFCPDDLQIVKGYSDARRESLDAIGSQISATYYSLKSEYQKAVKQKNALLGSPDPMISLLDPWNENIAVIGANLVKHRLGLYEVFSKNLVRTYKALVLNSEIDVVYIPSWEEEDDIEIHDNSCTTEEIQNKLLEKMERLKEAEIRTGRTLSGPHRDDLKFYIDGHDARKFASQGQQRSIALSWKIAEMQTIADLCGQQPILLLDDVLSEFDQGKRDELVTYLVNNNMQTFITATDVDYLDDTILETAKIFRIGGNDGYK